MRYSFFEIANFKGIEKVKIALNQTPRLNVYTLVGLNESGKTTILEAINYIGLALKHQESLESLELPGYSIDDVHELIPIGKRDNFNGVIAIRAGLSLDAEDEMQIKRHVFSEFGLTLEREIKEFTITRSIPFKDSKYNSEKKLSNVWNIVFPVKRKRARKISYLEGTEWLSTVNFIRDKLVPTILYFPNFLFDFPDKIYLETTESDEEKHAFYRLVVQDILDSLGTGTNLETHILARSKSVEKSDQKSLESLLLNMGRHVTSVVFDAWNKIFHMQFQKKEIIITHDSDAKGKYYLEFKLKDVDGYYRINERSLGFRWFFVFLLLTQYRGFRKGSPKNVLFLFDEPASNLHPSAQNQLLNSLDKLTENSMVIYTTHSHHLINAKWLEGAFVVRNEGLDYNDEINSYNAKKTKIIIDNYRRFAEKHPNQTSYFQPILDVLDYAPSQLGAVPNVTMLEGKNDFYTLNYFSEIILEDKRAMKFLPGKSSSSLEIIIALYLGWGINFVVLLDSDKEGKFQKKRYIESFGPIIENKIFTLDDINNKWSKHELEDIIPINERLVFQRTVYPDSTEYNKTHFNRVIQEKYITKLKGSFSEETIENFSSILNFLDSKLKCVET